MFVLIASIAVLLAIAACHIGGSKAAGTSNSMRASLTANNNTVMMVVFVVLGAELLGGGISVVF